MNIVFFLITELKYILAEEGPLRIYSTKDIWTNIKSKYCTMHGISDALFNTYI